MQIKLEKTSENEIRLVIGAKQDELKAIKDLVLKVLSKDVKIPGFRPGSAPAALIEKQLDQQRLQATFLEEAINQLYPQAINSEKIRPVAQPQIEVKKFVPFTDLEFEAVVTVLGSIKIADYKVIKMKPEKISVTPKDIDGVIERLALQIAEKKDVDRASANKDEVWIDFKGTDKKGEPINGADGKDYPLVLGSDTFIPGFEKNILGLKAGDEKTFKLKFPSDYQIAQLAGQEVTFAVKINKVQELEPPKIDDKFAAKAGPFQTLEELKQDVKKQLVIEKTGRADREFESKLVEEITNKSKLSIPAVLIEEQTNSLMQELRRNLEQRGQSMEDYLKSQGAKDDEDYKTKFVSKQAEQRVKASLVLAEIAELEQLSVTPGEIDTRLNLLRERYNDNQMREQLDKPEARREIASRILTEKTVEKLVAYAAK